VLAAVLTLAACGNQPVARDADTEAGKIKVSVTFNALQEFVAAVGRDKVVISTIIPVGMEPHDFEPRAKDLIDLAAADIFVYNGVDLESWTEQALSAIQQPNLIIVEASQGVERIADDPHVWLSLTGAALEVQNIRDALIQADPVNQAYYEGNCADFIVQLDNLYTEYQEKFRATTQKSFVSGHAAFAYLCRDFALVQNSVEDTFAEGEPSARQLSVLVEYCTEHAVTTIFTEEMVSKSVAETLAREVGATVETLYTMESAEGDRTYLERMSDNLAKIYASLTNG
jgi:zinc transport system substrate-binding protein